MPSNVTANINAAELASTADDHPPLAGMIGSGSAMKTVYARVRGGPTRSTILIHGETGSGKELVARVSSSQRPTQPTVYCCQLCRYSRNINWSGIIWPRKRRLYRCGQQTLRSNRGGWRRYPIPRWNWWTTIWSASAFIALYSRKWNSSYRLQRIPAGKC